MKILHSIDMPENPAKLEAGLATRFDILDIGFAEWAETLEATGATPAEARKAQRAARLAKQVKAFNIDGAELPIKPGELLNLPRNIYARISTKCEDFGEDDAGDIIAPGDGIDRPVIFRLAKPIIAVASTSGENSKDAQITDLEFVAKTGADIEDVMIESSSVSQTLALIKNCATPLNKDLSLLRLPSWALSQIGFPDGVAIMKKVLPAFLGEESK